MMYAAQCGLSHKNATPSSGTLVFGRSGTLPYDVLIPKGIVCAVPGKAGLRFETTWDIMLFAGAQTTQGPAVSQQKGKGSNATAGAVTLLLMSPVGMETVTNPQAFIGGVDEETDRELRKHLLRNYEVLPNGTNAEFYHSHAMQYDGVQSASVLSRADSSGAVAVYAASRGVAPPQALLTKIQSELDSLREVNVKVMVHSLELVSFPISIYIDPVSGCTLAAVTSQTLEVTQSYFDQPSVEESVILTQFSRRLIDAGLIRNYHFDETLAKDKKAEIAQPTVPDPVYVQQIGSTVQHEGGGFRAEKALAALAIPNGQ